jgi:hypothetical protein
VILLQDYKLVIGEEELGEIISKHIEISLHLKSFLGIEQFLLNQAKTESSLFVYATRYEKHIEDMSVGLFQILTKTAKDIGFNRSIGIDKSRNAINDPTYYNKDNRKYYNYCFIKEFSTTIPGPNISKCTIEYQGLI